MSDGPPPKHWQEALPLITWGVLIFAFGFEGVASLIHGEWWQAVFGFGGMLGLTTMLIHWTTIRGKFADLRWLIAASMIALTVVALSPYIEQQRWPFSTVIHDPPSADEIARVAAPQVEAAREREIAAKNQAEAAIRERDLARQERERAIQERDAARASTQTVTAPTAPAAFENYQLSDAQIQELANELFSIKNLLPSSVDIHRIMYDGSSMGLSIQISRAFDLASIRPLLNWNRPYTPRDSGIMIRVGNLQEIPDSAKKVQMALEKVTRIAPRFETMGDLPPDKFVIFVGPKP